MHRRIKLWLTARRLELSFVRGWMRLDSRERSRLVEDLRRPFRRQWYVVDGRGVRRLGDDE